MMMTHVLQAYIDGDWHQLKKYDDREVANELFDRIKEDQPEHMFRLVEIIVTVVRK
jgi:hypothetical protein